MPDYQPTQFNEGAAPGISAAELNKLGTQYGLVKSELEKVDGTGVIQPHGSQLVDGSVTDVKMGTRTADPATAAPYSLTGSVTQQISWIVKTIKAIKGVTGNWWDAAATNIATIWDRFHAISGHTHNATTGNGPKITSAGLANGAATDTAMGTRTADPATATAYALTGTLTQHLSWLTKNIKALKGVAGDWYDATSATIQGIWAKFHATTGHKHTGALGDGPKIPISSIDGGVVQPSSIAGILWGPGFQFFEGSSYTYGLAYSPTLGRLVAVTNYNMGYSDDFGENWTVIAPLTQRAQAVVWSPTRNLFVAVCRSRAIYSSPDGVTWTQRLTAGSGDFESVAWFSGGNVFIAVGLDGSTPFIYTSPDGITWTSRTVPAGTTNIRPVAVSPNEALIPATPNRVLRSTNGTSWASVALSAADTIYGVAYLAARGVWAAQGDRSGGSRTIYYSTDGGLTWEWRLGLPESASAKLFANDTCVVSLSYGSILATRDGKAWAKVATDITYSQYGELVSGVWTGSQFIVVGDYHVCVVSPPLA